MRMQVGAARVEYTDEGAGLPLVLLHAFATDRELWAPQVRALAGRCRVVVPDLRGHGGSSPTDGAPVSMDDYADDVRALVDHLGLGRVVVGGISLGGYVALAFALRHRTRTAGLVLANTRAVADNPELAQQREALVADILARGGAAVVESYGDKPFGPECPQAVRESVRRMILRQRPEGLVSGTRGMMQRPDRTPALASIAVPTLVIHGSTDQFIPPSLGRAMHEAIPGSRYVEIAGAGHLSNVDSPEAFNRALETFLDFLAKEPAP